MGLDRVDSSAWYKSANKAPFRDKGVTNGRKDFSGARSMTDGYISFSQRLKLSQ